MGFLVKFILGKVSGPFLVYVVLGLVAANAITGYLLKSAWKKNAQAVLVCENAALRDANEANELVTAELQQVQTDLIAKEARLQIQGEAAEVEIQRRILAKEIEHAAALADLEVATNDITDEEFFCATEPVAAGVLAGMRHTATTYNKNRNSPSTGTVPD